MCVCVFVCVSQAILSSWLIATNCKVSECVMLHVLAVGLSIGGVSAGGAPWLPAGGHWLQRFRCWAQVQNHGIDSFDQ